MKKHTYGFTIVELLIVIVIIGILAAISIVAYDGITNNANDSTIKSDLRNATNTMKQFLILNETSSYSTAEAMTGFSASKGAYATRNNLLYCRDNATQAFTFAAVSKSNKVYAYASEGGLSELSSLPSSAGGAAGACAVAFGYLPTSLSTTWGVSNTGSSYTWQSWAE